MCVVRRSGARIHRLKPAEFICLVSQIYLNSAFKGAAVGERKDFWMSSPSNTYS